MLLEDELGLFWLNGVVLEAVGLLLGVNGMVGSSYDELTNCDRSSCFLVVLVVVGECWCSAFANSGLLLLLLL